MNNDEIDDVTNRQIIPICDGCPAAITICCQLYIIGRHDNTNYLDILKNKNIVGYDIWKIYKENCSSNIHQMVKYLIIK